MTHYSLRICEFPDKPSGDELQSPLLKPATVQDLLSHARDCGAHGLRFWAERHDIPLHYVDNCWVRAVVDGQQVALFMAEVLKGDVTPGPQIDAGTLYLIEAEEY